MVGQQCQNLEMLRVTDYDVKFGGASNDMGNGDQWPLILEKVKACDIFIMAMPIWMGVRCSVGQMVIERLDGYRTGCLARAAHRGR